MGLIYQNLRSRFSIERYAYTESHIGQIPCVCMHVCMWSNYSQTTEPICIKKLYQQIEHFTPIAIGYLDLKYLPNTMNILLSRERRFWTMVASPQRRSVDSNDNVNAVTDEWRIRSLYHSVAR